jgi:hypothetical protein
MKHSKKESKPKGCSKGKNDDNVLPTGPIMIEDIMQDEPSYHKRDMAIRELNMPADPTNNQSPVIRRRFKPLDNPRTVLELLKGMQIIKEGCMGNNVITGPNQYAFWRGCLTGAAQHEFIQFAREVGTVTLASLLQVKQRLTAHFAQHEVLREQKKHMRTKMCKDRNTTAQQHVGAVATLIESLGRLPPDFNEAQQLQDKDIMDILSTKAPQEHKILMIEQGFNPETSTIEEFVQISERAETKQNIYKERKRHFNSDNESSSKDERRNKKKQKPSKARNYQSISDKKEFCCKEHGPNSTNNSSDCKVIHGKQSDKHQAWKSKDKSENKHSDYKSKYKNKSRKLNLLQMEAKRAKVKWTKACKKLEANNSSSSKNKEEPSELKNVKETVREDKPEVLNLESSSSSSSSDSDSE